MSKVGLLTLVEIPADISHVLKDACDVLQKPRACFDYLSIPLLFSVGSQYSRDHNGRDYTTFFPVFVYISLRCAWSHIASHTYLKGSTYR